MRRQQGAAGNQADASQSGDSVPVKHRLNLSDSRDPFREVRPGWGIPGWTHPRDIGQQATSGRFAFAAGLQFWRRFRRSSAGFAAEFRCAALPHPIAMQ